MAIVEDFPAYFTDFGTSAIVGGVAVMGIFDNASADAFGIASNTRSTLLIASVDAPSVAVGDAVVVGNTSYTVAAVEPDGTGATLLVMK